MAQRPPRIFRSWWSALSRRYVLPLFSGIIAQLCIIGGEVREERLISPSSFTADYWSVEEGLPRHSITALAQSTDGYLWIGMFDGIARFDGTSFRIFDQHSVDVLKSHSIRSIHADPLGKVWFGTAGGGISCYSKGRFVTYHTEDFDIASNYIGAVLVNTQGHVFIGSSGNGISQFEDGKVIAWNAGGQYPELKAVSSLFQDRFGRIWAGTDGGLLQWMDDPDWAQNEGEPWIMVTTDVSTTKVWKRLPVSTGMPLGKAVVVDEMPDGRLVVLHADGKLFQERHPQSGTFDALVDLHAQFPEKTNWIATRSMAIGRDGSVWVGDQGAGLFRVHNGVAEVFKIDGKPVEEKVWALLADKDGNIWVGGRSEGLMRIRRRVFQNYTTDHGLSDNLITSIMEDASHKIWISTSAGGISVVDENKIKLYTQTESMQDARITCMLERSLKETWIGTYGQGLFEMSKEGVHRPSAIELPTALKGDGMVYSLISDGAGGLYVGTWGQHIFHLPKEGTPYRLAEEVDNRTVLTRVLAIDQEGTLWSGGKYGLLYRKPGENPVAVSADSGLPDCEIYSLFVDREGILWVGTYGEGLFRKQADRFVRYRLGESFVENSVSSIIEDDDGFIWLGTFTGIRRASRHHLLSDGDPEWSHYGKSDGLGTYEMSGGHLGTVMKTSDGRLWFGTTYGLAVVDPANLANESVAPKPVIEKLVIDGVLMNGMAQETREAHWRDSDKHAPDTTKIWDDSVASDGLSLAPVTCRSSNHRYEFHIGALQFIHPQSVSFRYRILGFDEAWHEIGKQRVIHIYDLPPGEYKFEISARSVLPMWSGEMASVSLVVTPELWETTAFKWVFFSLMAGVVIWSGRYFSQRRLLQQLEKTSEQKRLFEDRSRISETLHDDLGANLTQMALLSDASRRETALPEKTQAHIHRIASLARQSMRRLDEIVWAINPANDHLQQWVDYLCSYADEFFESSDTKVRFDLPDQLDSPCWPSRSRLEVFLAFKECLNNIAKSAEATLVTIRLEQSAKSWLLRISDNGKGIASEKVSQGHGLGNMKRRLERIGGGCQVESTTGNGTVVTFTLPQPSGMEELKS